MRAQMEKLSQKFKSFHSKTGAETATDGVHPNPYPKDNKKDSDIHSHPVSCVHEPKPVDYSKNTI